MTTGKLETLGHDGLMFGTSRLVSHDGKRSVVFRGDSTEWMLNLDDRKVHPIQVAGYPVGWSAQRTLLLYRREGSESILEELNPETGVVTRIASVTLPIASTATVSSLLMTPDRKRIVYSVYDATSDLYTLRLPDRSRD